MANQCEVMFNGEALMAYDFLGDKDDASMLRCAFEDNKRKIEQMLCTSPTIASVVRNLCESTGNVSLLRAVFTDDQKQKLADGVLKLMSAGEKGCYAELVDPTTNRVVYKVPLKAEDLSPELMQSLTNLMMQVQLAQLAADLHAVGDMVKEVCKGQENDRLAIAYSCYQRMIQAMKIQSSQIKTQALLGIVADAENSRNQLMLSQRENIEYIRKQPKDVFGKFLSGASTKKNDDRMKQVWQNLRALNGLSWIEVMAYQNLGELEAAKQSLSYYAGFIDSVYMKKKDDGVSFVDRLDSMGASTDDMWNKNIGLIVKRIDSIQNIEVIPFDNKKLIGGGKYESQNM